MKPISVTELTKQIKNALGAPSFQGIVVEGEISNFINHASGHMYFSLKDSQSRIKAVMFRSRNQRLGFLPKNGDTLLAVGSLGVYEPNGEYQLYVDQIFPVGIGELHLAFEQLKEKLEKEGLFCPEHKRPLPFLPHRIGIITSPSGAALRDILHVLTRRFPGVQVLVIPALVQGDGAPASLRKALLQAQSVPLDVIILGRGGGSFEELAAFNDEALARDIYACPIPVVSAVGHETDFTIADFVADLRAPTPSAAAELVVPLQEDLLRAVQKSRERMLAALRRRIQTDRRYLNQLAARPVLQRPDHHLNQLRQRLDEYWADLGRYQRHILTIRRGELGGLVGRLETLSPLKTLGRGYAICQNEQGEVIRGVEQVEPGQELKVRLQRGQVFCRVERRKSHDGVEI